MLEVLEKTSYQELYNNLDNKDIYTNILNDLLGMYYAYNGKNNVIIDIFFDFNKKKLTNKSNLGDTFYITKFHLNKHYKNDSNLCYLLNSINPNDKSTINKDDYKKARSALQDKIKIEIENNFNSLYLKEYSLDDIMFGFQDPSFLTKDQLVDSAIRWLDNFESDNLSDLPKFYNEYIDDILSKIQESILDGSYIFIEFMSCDTAIKYLENVFNNKDFLNITYSKKLIKFIGDDYILIKNFITKKLLEDYDKISFLIQNNVYQYFDIQLPNILIKDSYLSIETEEALKLNGLSILFDSPVDEIELMNSETLSISDKRIDKLISLSKNNTILITDFDNKLLNLFIDMKNLINNESEKLKKIMLLKNSLNIVNKK